MAGQSSSGMVHLFGKLPSHGDFISRGFAAVDRDALDRWVSNGLDAASAAFGTAFGGFYDQAPPWRFAALNGGSATAGALAPSVDRAGRRYPLYLGLNGIQPDRVGNAAEWCEALIRDAICEGWDADRLVDEAARFVSGPDAAPLPELPCWWVVDGEGAVADHRVNRWPEHLLSIMLQPQEDY